ncbi:S8 family serine peptidase [Candidatus Poriferisodalis sp.]|uniref:S8 family serine peptidase n=1 Tax=Candidatus Poriferisodalis sp. TaxID=3101277 RepID=UPI003AF57E95
MARLKRAALVVFLFAGTLALPVLTGDDALAQTPPAAPTITAVGPGDEALTVAWSAPAGVTGISSYDLRFIDSSSSAADKADDANWRPLDPAWEAGSLRVIVTGLVNDTSYDVQVRAVTTSEGDWSSTETGTPTDPGSSRENATAIVDELPVRGVLDSSADDDWFLFSISDEREYVIVTTGDTDTYGTLYRGSTIVPIAFNDDSNLTSAPLNFKLDGKLSAGTYYLKVTGADDATGDYTLWLQTFADTTGVSDATGIDLDSSSVAVFHGTGATSTSQLSDVDFFKLELATATTITARASGFVADTVGAILDADGSVVASNDDAWLEPSHEQFALRTTLAAGTYYIRVKPFEGDAAGLYYLHVYESPDPGNSRPTAAEIGTSTTAGGTIDSASDYFTFTLDRSTRIVLVGVGEANIEATVQDSAGQVLGLNYYALVHRFFSGNLYAFAIFDTLEAGTYYLKVDGDQPGDTGEYLVLLRPDAGYERLADICSEARTSTPADIADPLYGCQWHLDNDGQFGGTAGEDINIDDAVLGSVWDIATGSGINVKVVDSGLDYLHEDLLDNVDTDKNHSYRSVRDVFSDPSGHGTAVAGLIAAGDNSSGVRGVAPRVTIYGYDLVSASSSLNAADAVARDRQTTSVSNHSYGVPDSPRASRATRLWEMAIDAGVTEGDDGKGVVYVWAAGNGDDNGDYASLAEAVTYYGVIAVCAVDHRGKRSYYSEWGPNLWVCAPSDSTPKDHPLGIVTTPGIMTTRPYSTYRDTFGGTSAAAPIVSGVVALVREVNPTLTWRDVKLILAASARTNNATISGWEAGARKYGSTASDCTTPSECYSFNHQYGFGVVDASAAVALAQNWTNVADMRTATAADATRRRIASTNGTATGTVDLGGDVDFVEFVEINIDFNAPFFRDLNIELVSPSGATSVLTERNSFDCRRPATSCALTGEFRFGSARHLGEDPRGTWTLRVSDRVAGGTANVVRSWDLKVYGHRQAPGPVPLRYVQPASGSLIVAWDGPDSTGTSPLTGYDLRHIRSDATDKSDANWTVITGAGSLSSRSHTIENLTDGVQRDVQVRAVGDRTGEWSTTARGTPGATNSEPFFVDGESTIRMLAENVGSGADVGSAVTASDAESDSFTYSLSGVDAASFELDASTGQIMTAFDPDFESREKYTVTISVSDSKDAAGDADSAVDDTIAVSVVVIDHNEPPIVVGPPAIDVVEGTQTPVGSYTVTDPEGQDISGLDIEGPDAAEFDYNRATFHFTGRAPISFRQDPDHVRPDFEDRLDANGDNVYEIQIVTSDGRHTTTFDVTVTVTDVNEAPTLTYDSRDIATVDENGIATGLSFSVNDPENDSIEWTLSGADEPDFDVSGGVSGAVLTFKDPPDFEMPTDRGGNNIYNVNVEASDGANLVSLPVVVVVRGVNEPAVISGLSARNFPENSTGVVADYGANDPEEGEGVAWSLSGADRGFFEISSGGVLRFAQSADPPDHEAARGDTYRVTVQASDGKDDLGNLDSSVDDRFDVTVTVTDVNEKPVFPTGVADMATVVEGRTVTGLSFSVDDPEGDRIVWTLSGADRLVFDISGGVLAFKDPPDFEMPADQGGNNTYNVDVEASDGANLESLPVVVVVEGVNEPPVIGGPPARNYPENGTGVVADFSANDPEEHERVAWSLSGADRGFFEIDSGGVLRFAESAGPPDHEAARGDTYRVTVEASDGKNGLGSLDSSVDDRFDVTVTVTNVDEAPVITSGPVGGSVSEGAVGVFAYAARDPEGDIVSWTLRGPDGAALRIDEFGVVGFDPVPDFEAPVDAGRNNSYAVVVVATAGSLEDTRGLTVSVVNVDELGGFGPFSRPQAGTALTAVLSDPDGGVGGAVWSWERSQVGSRSGWALISGAGSRSYEPVGGDVGRYLRVSVSYRDREGPGKGVMSSSLGPVLAAPLTNQPPTFPYAVTVVRVVPEDSPAGTSIGAPVEASDPDAADQGFLTYSLGPVGAALFDIDAASGRLLTRRGVVLDHEARSSYEVTVTVRDPSGETDFQQVAVSVTDVNEAPVITGGDVEVYAEDRADAVGSFTAVDPEGEAVTWSLAGADSADFEIDDSGSLRWVVPPDYEQRADADRDNDYEVVVVAEDEQQLPGEYSVTVRVTDVNETPTVSCVSSRCAHDVQSGHTAISWREERDGVVGVFSGADPEGVSVTWSLGGPDGEDFEIDDSGILRWVAPPDYEQRADADRGNDYAVVVQASDGNTDGALTVTVTVTDVEEPGTLKLELSGSLPEVGKPLRAVLDDPDKPLTAHDWTWRRSGDRDDPASWELIDGATASTYRPVAADAGHWLRVDVAYKDAHSPNDQSEAPDKRPPAAVTINSVPAPTNTNNNSSSSSSGSSSGSSRGGSGGGGGGGDFDVGVATFVVANGWSPADIGAASVLAARTADAAVLYTAGDELSEQTRLLLRETLPAEVIIVGGNTAVTRNVRTQIRAASSESALTRITGQDRADTAAATARRILGTPATAGRVTLVIANGWSPPDIGAAAALAARSSRSAVLYTQTARLPTPSAALLADYEVARVILIGGTAAINDDVHDKIAAAAGTDTNITRLTGTDRTHTAAATARRVLGNPAAAPDSITLVIANGWSPPDIGVAAALAAATPNAAVAYTAQDTLPDTTTAFIHDYRPTQIIIIGGRTAIANNVRTAITQTAPDSADIRRITGATRTDTAARAARRILANL